MNPTEQQPSAVLARAKFPIALPSLIRDLPIIFAAFALFYALLSVTHYWVAPVGTRTEIQLSIGALPRYAMFSLLRIVIAYVISLIFTLAYGYVAAYNARAERFMLPLLDTLQSIPVLSFLPGVMLAMVALFPTRNFGIELGSILLIFTGMVWNMTFSFYSSLKAIPREMREVAEIYRWSWWQRFVQMELPFSVIGLVWNSMMSVAGGWFFLMACEMFILGDRDLRLPGLGSYLQTAADAGNGAAISWGLITMILIIVTTDQLIWRPLIAWSDKFKFEQVESSKRITSPILHLINHSNALASLSRHTLTPLTEGLYPRLAARRLAKLRQLAIVKPASRVRVIGFRIVVLTIVTCTVLYAAFQAVDLLRPLPGAEYLHILKGAAATFLRVNLSLVLASAWTIPVGVAIGSNPRLARLAQPLAQIAASVPATALFPVLLLALVRVGGGMGIGSIALMLLGTQWYILFNVIAGAIAIPSDLKEVATLFHFNTVQRWKTVILPSIFPFLITGLVTASGGAWNASIIAEYFPIKGQILQTVGLGAIINEATGGGRFPVLLLATIVMSLMVVTTNRLVWRPLFRLAETRYKLG